MNRALQRVVRGLCLLAWMGVIYYLSNQPDSNELTLKIFGAFNYYVRKGAHVTEYAVLFGLSLWFQSSFEGSAALDRLIKKGPPVSLLLPLVFSLLFALSDEWHQSFIPGRSSLLSDVWIDSGGSLIAAVIAFVAGKRRRKTL